MILEIWIFLFAVAIAVLIVGFTWRADAFKVIAFTIMFILGTTMLFNQLEYESGTNITLNGSTYVVQPVYTTLSSHTVSWLVTIASVAGFVFTLVDRRKKADE